MKPYAYLLYVNLHPQTSISINTSQDQRIEIIPFPLSFSTQLESPLHLFHSFSSTPARYIELAFARALELKLEGHFLILNPAIQFTTELYDLLMTTVHRLSQESITVISTLNDRPLGYFFGSKVIQTIQSSLFRLRFLSAISASLDHIYLQVAFQIKTELCVHPFDMHLNNASGFYFNGYESIYTLMTQHALLAYHQPQQDPLCIGVIPYHAGDLLFFLKAANHISHPFNTLLVHEEFTDIVKKCAPHLKIITVKENCLGRGTNHNPALTTHGNKENLFFYNVLYPYIPKNAVFYWFRPSRDDAFETFSQTHWIDQWKTALSNERFSPVCEEKRAFLSKKTPLDKSVLLHFDGGWALKIYPQKEQEELLTLLTQKGYRISILTDRPISYPYPFFGFESLQKLEENILSHSIFVGMDSFPAHFSTHVFQHPTLCLFSSTYFSNSNASIFEGYQYLQSDLKCCPCYGIDTCRRFSQTFCKNFASPTLVAETIDTMFQRCYGDKGKKAFL